MGVFCGELVQFVAPFCLTTVDISVHQEWFARFRERANRPGAVVRACRCQGQIKKKGDIPWWARPETGFNFNYLI